MSWRREEFRLHYRERIGTRGSSNSYVSYLNLVDQLILGLDEALDRSGATAVANSVWSRADNEFTSARTRGHCLSALSAYIAYKQIPVDFVVFADPVAPEQEPDPILTPPQDEEIFDLLRQAKALAARYYHMTGKPLGVTGEVAEMEAAARFGLTLSKARSPGFDAVRADGWRVQIKGRAVASSDRYRGRCPSIKGDAFDSVVLVLLDKTTYETLEIWEAPRDDVLARIAAPGSKARTERHSLAIAQFKSIADRVWSASKP